MFCNEKNSPLNHPFAKAAYKSKKYAFVADYVRFWMLFQYGGIYLDTDMLILKPLDHFLNHDVFLGKEDENQVNGAILGAVPRHPFIKDCLNFYNRKFDIDKLDEIAIPRVMSKLITTYNDIKIFDQEYFYPYPFLASVQTKTPYQKYLKPNSHAVHLWNASWIDGMEQHRAGLGIWRRIKRKISLFRS